VLTKLSLASDSDIDRLIHGPSRAVRVWSRCCCDACVTLRPGRSRADIEALVGRSFAMCVHPYAAWRSRSTRCRTFVLLAYFVGGYALVLGALFLSDLNL